MAGPFAASRLESLARRAAAGHALVAAPTSRLTSRGAVLTARAVLVSCLSLYVEARVGVFIRDGDSAMMDDWALPVVAWEIQARDPAKLRDFYGQMFNWSLEGDPLIRIRAGIGGPEPGPIGHIREGSHPGVSLFIQVRDLGASREKAVELGGKALGQPRDTPGGPTVAGILDPEGNRIMLVQQ